MNQISVSCLCESIVDPMNIVVSRCHLTRSLQGALNLNGQSLPKIYITHIQSNSSTAGQNISSSVLNVLNKLNTVRDSN